MRGRWLTLRPDRNRSCYGCKQRFAFNGARPIDASFRAESAYGWHGLCCHLVKGTAKPRERDARRALRPAEALQVKPTHRQPQSS